MVCVESFFNKARPVASGVAKLNGHRLIAAHYALVGRNESVLVAEGSCPEIKIAGRAIQPEGARSDRVSEISLVNRADIIPQPA